MPERRNSVTRPTKGNAVVSALNDTAAGAGSAATEVRLAVPATPVFLSSMRWLDNGVYQMTLNGGIGRVYTIQSSSNLSNWTSLFTLTNLTGATSALDATAPGASRFYRAVEQ